MKIPPTMNNVQIIDAAVDAATDVSLPSASKLDKADGVVPFGDFGTPVYGHTAQVRVRSDGNIEVTVRRGMSVISLSPDEEANKFATALKQRLQDSGAAQIQLNVTGSPTT